MPSKLRAGGVFPFILADDREETTDPQFNLRVLSAQENAELSILRTEYIAAETLLERLKVLRSALSLTVVDCFLSDSEPIESLLTETECWEVINGSSGGSLLTAEERKKFVSPHLSETANFVGDVVASA